jgi:hypothetical protein
MHEQARTAGLIIAIAALLIFPAWNGFDVLLEPDLASSFLVVRLAALVPIATAGWLLWRSPSVGACPSRRPWRSWWSRRRRSSG